MYNNSMDILDGNTDNGIFATVSAGLPRAGVRDPSLLAPLVLAYIGDTVFDLYVRTGLVTSTDLTAHGLHMAAAKKVCAGAQASSYKRIEGLLTEEEAYVFRRGRNAHNGTVPKNAAIGDYRAATGLEALVGWLYLKGEDARLNELMRVILEEEK